MRLKTYKMVMSILPKFLTLKWNLSRTIWRIEVGDGPFFCIFHALSFELNLFFNRREVPFKWPLQLLLVPWTENHLSSFKCGFLNIFSRQNLLRSLSNLLFLLRWNKNGVKKCLKNHIPFDF